jgi:hypothetical protein
VEPVADVLAVDRDLVAFGSGPSDVADVGVLASPGSASKIAWRIAEDQ